MIARMSEVENLQEGKVNKVMAKEIQEEIAKIKDKGNKSQEEIKKIVISVTKTSIINEKMAEEIKKDLIKILNMEEQIGLKQQQEKKCY